MALPHFRQIPPSLISDPPSTKQMYKNKIKSILQEYPEILNELIVEQRQEKLTKIINKI